MSLAVLADHMASKGRGPDSMLIHMSPREVQGLQALAIKNGGSLTINPETGLPEAGFLDKLLPAIIGFGISYISGGTIDPKTAAMIVGGVETARTGDIGKGISAGLGAYGGAGIGAGMTAAGTEAIGSQAAGQSYLSSYVPPGVLEGAGAGLSADMAYNLGQAGVVDAASTQAASVAQQAAAEKIAAASPFEKLTAGAEKIAANPMGYATKDNFKYLAAAAAPILADQAVTAKGPQTTTKPGMIRPYSFDPYGGTYTAGTPYEAQIKKAAYGGLMGMDDGGYNPGQLDFTQRSEPVVRMARGGIAHFEGGGNTADVGSGGGDAALAAYQAGNYEEANRLLGEAGMGAQDVVSKYGLSQADAATVAQNLGYKGDMSGIQYAAPAAAAPTPTYFTQNPDVAAAFTQNSYGMTPEQFAQTHYTNYGQAEGRTLGGGANTSVDYFANQFAPDVFAPFATAPVATAPVATAPVATAPVVDTGGGLAALNQNLVTNTLKWIDTNPFATPEQINAAIKGSGMSIGDVNLALDSLVASGKISGSERYYIQQGKGLSAMADSTAKWLKDNPNATQTQIDAVLKAASMDIGDAQQVLAHGFQVADKDLTAATKYIQDNPDVARWITSDQGKAYIKEHPEFDAKDIAFTHYKRYGEKEGRKWGADTVTPPVVPPVVTPPVVTPPITYNTAGTNAPGGLEGMLGLPPGVSGAGITTVNPNGTITTRPNIPGIPEGGFTGMTSLRDAYEKGGGSLGVNKNLFAPTTTKQIEDRYKLTGGSKQSYDYLMGKTPYSPTPYTPTGEIMKPYFESVGRAPVNLKTKKYVYVDGKYQLNPEYVKPSYVLAGEKAAADKAAGLTNKDAKPTTNPGAGNDWVWNTTDSKWEAKPIEAASNTTTTGQYEGGGGGGEAAGGLMATGGLAALTMANGGRFSLGDYSDGGRLLRGPGDGVSDSIPASIGGKRPARLADGEFVVPARIVSELGNGSTEAGARKLYAMMDRVQAARKSSIGKGRVAKNSRSDKYLPA